MGLPVAQEARPFYRAFGLLKALVLSVVPAEDRQAMVANFRGTRAHNYDWLKARYFEHGGTPFPSEIAKALALVNTWDTEWRYRAGLAARREAEDLLRAAETIILWVDGRL